MAVDLSRVGLEGIETGQRTLSAMAQRDALAASTSIAQAEEQREADALALDQLAATRAREIMAGNGVDFSGEYTEEDAAHFMELAGSQLIGAGALKRGSEMIQSGMDIRKKRADIDKSADDQNKTRLDNIKTAGNYLWEALADVKNQGELDYVWSSLPPEIMSILGEDSVEQLKAIPYSVDWVAMARDKALTSAQEATFANQAQSQARLERALDNSQAAAEAANRLGWARLEEAKRARSVQEKAEGKTGVSKAPTTDERIAARRAIMGNVEGLTFAANPNEDPADIQAAVDDIVSSAKQLVEENKGLTFGEAVNRAVLQAKAGGDFNTIRTYRDFGLFETDGTKDTTYSTIGKTADNPRPMPEGDAATVKKQLRKGRYYATKMGNLKWNGTEFEE